MEEYKIINEHPNYEISNTGVVRDVKTKAIKNQTRASRKGYKLVCINGKQYLVHRLVAEDDVKAIGESMGLSKEQRMVMPKLLTGQCIVNSSLSTETYWLKINKVK